MRHIPIVKQEFEGTELNSVNSRDLHSNLEVKTEYKKWADRLIEKYGFTENEDFLTIVKNDGRNKSIDYIVTLDVAKEICMVSNTEKGRETRKYFISIEKQHNSMALSSLKDHQHKIQSLLEYTDKMGEVVTEHDKRISNLEKNTRIEAWQQKQLLDVKNRKVYELANGNEKLATKLHRNIWKHFKDRFHIPRYDALTQGKYNDGLTWLETLTIDMVV